MERILIKIASISLSLAFTLFVIGAFTDDDLTIMLGFGGLVVFIACALLYYFEDLFND